MSNYRRVFVPGGRWFFTVNLLDRRSRLLTDKIDLFREAVRDAKHRYPFEIDAIVVLPNHLHAIWTLPQNDNNFPQRWRWLKRYFSRGVDPPQFRTTSEKKRGDRGIWQRRYWEHLIRDERDFAAHVNYCYFNPVKHGLIEQVRGLALLIVPPRHEHNAGSDNRARFRYAAVR